MGLILPNDYSNKEEYQLALEDCTDKVKHFALQISESLDYTCYQVPVFDQIDLFLKHAEGSIRRARRTIKVELEGREANRRRQLQKTKEKKE